MAYPAHAEYTIHGKIIKVSDGDTVHLLDENYQRYKIRLWGIDAPEKSQAFGNKSKKMLAQFIAGQYIKAVCLTNKDRYQRYLCTLFKDDININKKMVANGGAWVYTRYNNDASYRPLQQRAKREKKGLWSTTEAQAIEPSQWRKQKRQASIAPTEYTPAVHVKLSRNRICHARGTKYYNRVKRYTSYNSLEACLQRGRLPRG